MRVLVVGGAVLSAALCLFGCDDGGSGGGGSGTGGVAGGSAGGSGGSTGGTSGASTGGSSGSSTGGSSGGGTGGSAGDCSVLSFNTCQPLDSCMLANCGDEIAACYGPNYASDDGTGSMCESVWTCSKDTCTCGDNNCLVLTCYPPSTQECKDCISAITACMNTNCSDELQQCGT